MATKETGKRTYEDKPLDQGDTRGLEVRVDLDASAEEVWRALATADGLVKWFPRSAEVEPGVGGKILMSWNNEWSGEGKIEIWEPSEHLRYTWPFHAGQPTRVATDFFIEKDGAQTVLRLVHTGFSKDAKWDEVYNGTRRGWAFELRGLRHYLERHIEETRHVAHARVFFDGALEEGWRRVVSPDGLAAADAIAGKREGDAYVFKTADGDHLSGAVEINDPPLDFCGTVDLLNDAYFAMRFDNVEGSAENRPEANLWLSAYGLPEDEVRTIEARWQSMLDRLFAA